MPTVKMYIGAGTQYSIITNDNLVITADNGTVTADSDIVTVDTE
jgi:hypothetical protein